MKKFTKTVYRTYKQDYEFEAVSIEQAEEIWNDFDWCESEAIECDEEPAVEVTQ
jgi:hypothetical protein